MLRKFALAAAFMMGAAACSSADDDAPNDDAGFDGGVAIDTGLPNPVDVGFPDLGPRPDVGFLDIGFPDAGAPPDEVTVSGRVVEFGAYLGGDTVYVEGAAISTYGVNPEVNAIADPAGNYELVLPANGQAVVLTTKGGYNQTFYSITTTDQPYPGRNLYIASGAWLSEIANAHNVDLNTPFACQTEILEGRNCLYAAVVGRILDDGTAGNGVIRPVAGVTADDFTIYGTNNSEWYARGPYFLDYTGTSSVGAQGSVVYNDNGDYRGGLYATFVEVPLDGPNYVTIQISIDYLYNGATRYFGPVDFQAFRSPGGSVQFVNVPETGAPPPPPVDGVDFDAQIYPLFLPVGEGGFGCVGCHTNQGGAAPAAGMNLYGGPAVAYEALDPNQYPTRVNVQSPDDSYLLTRPLFGHPNNQVHPIFAFTSPQDTAYVLIRTWIAEGALRNNNNLPPVSFYNDVRPLLYQPTGQGGLGCNTCHVELVSGGFSMAGNGNDLYDALTNQAPTNAGPYNEAYRINKEGYPERSLVLTNPLFGDNEPHPVKIFSDTADARYQLIFRWIAEGYVNDTP